MFALSLPIGSPPHFVDCATEYDTIGVEKENRHCSEVMLGTLCLMFFAGFSRRLIRCLELV